MSAQDIIRQSELSFELRPIQVKDLIYIKKSPGDIYIYENRLYSKVIGKNQQITRDDLKSLLANKHFTLFIDYESYAKIHEVLRSRLIKVTRSLSVGDPQTKVPAQMNLLSRNMASIYQNPLDTESIKLQFQSINNFSTFLSYHPNEINKFYADFAGQNHHYTLAQPMLSTLMLMGFISKNKLFSDKETQKLFAASYFKDIGMSLIPSDKFDIETPNNKDKNEIADHAGHSVQVLENRVALTPEQIELIANHHKIIEETDNTDIFYGFETMIVSITDIIAAMTSDRPYRKRHSLYQSLEYIREILGQSHAKEFKLLVIFLKNFFK